jgi:hypothetical protein
VYLFCNLSKCILLDTELTNNNNNNNNNNIKCYYTLVTEYCGRYSSSSALFLEVPVFKLRPGYQLIKSVAVYQITQPKNLNIHGSQMYSLLNLSYMFCHSQSPSAMQFNNENIFSNNYITYCIIVLYSFLQIVWFERLARYCIYHKV